jgi:hypothetical protein
MHRIFLFFLMVLGVPIQASQGFMFSREGAKWHIERIRHAPVKRIRIQPMSQSVKNSFLTASTEELEFATAMARQRVFFPMDSGGNAIKKGLTLLPMVGFFVWVNFLLSNNETPLPPGIHMLCPAIGLALFGLLSVCKYSLRFQDPCVSKSYKVLMRIRKALKSHDRFCVLLPEFKIKGQNANDRVISIIESMFKVSSLLHKKSEPLPSLEGRTGLGWRARTNLMGQTAEYDLFIIHGAKDLSPKKLHVKNDRTLIACEQQPWMTYETLPTLKQTNILFTILKEKLSKISFSKEEKRLNTIPLIWMAAIGCFWAGGVNYDIRRLHGFAALVPLVSMLLLSPRNKLTNEAKLTKHALDIIKKIPFYNTYNLTKVRKTYPTGAVFFSRKTDLPDEEVLAEVGRLLSIAKLL